MADYKVSVVVPVYNTKRYLKDMLDSLRLQTLDNFEVILIDDGSTDGSSEYIKEYIENNSLKDFKLVLQENSGPSVARNKGIDMSSGEYICFFDSDDKVPLNALELMYGSAKENNALIVVGGTYKFNEEREWKINSHFLGDGFKDVLRYENIIWTLGPCNKMFNRSLIQDIRFPISISNGEDQCFVMESFLKAKQIYSISKLVYYYRERGEESCSLTDEHVKKPALVLKQSEELWEIISKIIDFYVPNKYDNKVLKINYIKRMTNINIWSPLKNAIDSKSKDVQINSMNSLYNILRNIDSDVLSESFLMHRLCTAWIIDRYISLCKEAKIIYLEILKHMFNSIDNNALIRIRKKYPIMVPYLNLAAQRNTLWYIKKYLFKRKSKKIKKEKVEKIKVSLRNPLLKLSCKLRGIDNNKLILASNKSDVLNDNLLFIEREARNHNPELKIVYYGKKNRNLIDMIKLYWDFGNAKNIVLDDYYNPLYGANFNKNINVIQVWHACGAFKKFGFSALDCLDSNTLEFERKAHLHYTHVLASSKNIVNEYSEAFGIDKKKVLPIGVPRTDAFFDEDYKACVINNIKSKYQCLDGKKIILYAPTFRISPDRKKITDIRFDMKYWYENTDENTVLILKTHPSVSKGVSIPNKYADRILDLSKLEKIEDLLIVADVLISDYSSLVFEFALMEKPIIFYAYDLEDYINERDFYYEYKEFIPGELVKTTQDIVKLIKEDKYDIDKIKIFRNKFFDEFDGKSCERFCKEFLKLGDK